MKMKSSALQMASGQKLLKTRNLREKVAQKDILSREDNVQERGGSVRLYGGIWVLACIALCGATGAHTSELHFLQAHHAIHRGDRNTCIQT